ncbi:hypothetical protein [Chryseobacterium sp.]
MLITKVAVRAGVYAAYVLPVGLFVFLKKVKAPEFKAGPLAAPLEP